MAQMNMQQMMKQARKMQEQLAAAQENLKSQTVDASAGGGMVKVTVNGEMELVNLTIDPDALDPEDVDMLQDMIMAGRRERGAARRGRPREPSDGRHHRRPQHPGHAVLRHAYIYECESQSAKTAR
mgnify:CR=1 FL=1